MTEEYRWAVREQTLGVCRCDNPREFDRWVAAIRVEKWIPTSAGNLFEFLSLELDVGAVARSIQSTLGWFGLPGFVVTFCAPPGLPLRHDEPTVRSLIPKFSTCIERHPTRSLIDAVALERLNRRWAQRIFLIELLSSGGVLRTRIEPITMEDLPSALEVVVSDRRIYSLAGETLNVSEAGETYRPKNREGSRLEHSRQLLGLHERSAAELETVLFSKLRADSDTMPLLTRAREKLVAARTLREALRIRATRVLELLLDPTDEPGRLNFVNWLQNADVDAVPPPLLQLEFAIIKRSCPRATWLSLAEQYKRLGPDLIAVARERVLSRPSVEASHSPQGTCL